MNTLEVSTGQRRRRAAAFVLAVLLAVGGAVASGQDNHHLNWRYVMWKYHVSSFDRPLVLRFLAVDHGFRASLIGKHRADLEGWFPLVRAPDPSEGVEAKGDILRRYPGFLWIVEPVWGVDVVDDRVRAVLLVKG